MAKSSTTINKNNRSNMPARGRSNKTIILEAMREDSLLGLSEESTKEECEKEFFKSVARSAFNQEDPNRGMCLKLLADKGWANVKPTNDLVSFEFDEEAKPHIQASQVMNAASKGIIPTDIATSFIQSIKAMIDIEEYTDLKDRIEKLERLVES